MVKKKIKKSKTIMKKQMRKSKRIEYKDRKKTVVKIKNIEKVVNDIKIVMEDKFVKSKKIRMVKVSKLFKRRVPMAFSTDWDRNCPCFKEMCACSGELFCDCEYPKCVCAPQAYETVDMVEEHEEP